VVRPLEIAATPLADGVAVDAQLACNLTAGLTIGAAQHDARPLRQTIARLPTLGPAPKLGPILRGDDQYGVVGAAAWHDVYLIE